MAGAWVGTFSCSCCFRLLALTTAKIVNRITSAPAIPPTIAPVGTGILPFDFDFESEFELGDEVPVIVDVDVDIDVDILHGGK